MRAREGEAAAAAVVLRPSCLRVCLCALATRKSAVYACVCARVGCVTAATAAACVSVAGSSGSRERRSERGGRKRAAYRLSLSFTDSRAPLSPAALACPSRQCIVRRQREVGGETRGVRARASVSERTRDREQDEGEREKSRLCFRILSLLFADDDVTRTTVQTHALLTLSLLHPLCCTEEEEEEIQSTRSSQSESASAVSEPYCQRRLRPRK